MIRTYEEVARATGVTWCRGCETGDHDKGWADMSHGVVHWRDRRFRREGLRRFLMFVADIVLNHHRGQPRWLIVYERNVWAYRYALARFHMKLPVGKADRRYVRQRVSRDNNTVYMWSYRGEHHAAQGR